MRTVIIYNILAVGCILLLMSGMVRMKQSNLSAKVRIFLKSMGIVLIVAVIGYIVFIDAIALGIIGLVPN